MIGLIFACVLSAVAGSFPLPTKFASSWDVKFSNPPPFDSGTFYAYAEPGKLKTKLYFTNYSNPSVFTDFLSLSNGTFSQCYSFDPYNGTCAQENEKVCESYKPLWSEFDDPQTVETKGCGGAPNATLLNVTEFHLYTSELCYDSDLDRPLYYRRESPSGWFLARIVAFVAEAVYSDFEVPHYCRNHTNATSASGSFFLFHKNKE
jgi:hypothetical protein